MGTRIFVCDKCNWKIAEVRWRKNEEDGEFLACKCSRCEYSWREEVTS